jgi:hypothetical protein
MFDTRFTPGIVPNTYPDIIQREGVLDRIYFQRAGGNSERRKTEIQNNTLMLVGLRRQTLENAAAAGWTPGRMPISSEQAAANLQFAKNCCPSFTICEQRTRCCRQPHFCPFCYARLLRDIYLTVIGKFPQVAAEATSAIDSSPSSNAIPNSRHRRRIDLQTNAPTGTAGYDLIVRRRSFNVGFTDTAVHEAIAAGTSEQTPDLAELDMPAASRWLVFHLAKCIEGRKSLMAKVRATIPSENVSAIIWTIAFPTVRCWRIVNRQIFVIPHDAEFPGDLFIAANRRKTGNWLNRYERPSQWRVRKSLSRLLAYPVSLLRGDPRLIATILHARQIKKQKLYACYGDFFGAQPESD